MIAGHHLTLVTERDESLEAFEAFRSAFSDGATPFPDHVFGYQGGSHRVDVHWHGSAKFWGLFVRPPKHYPSGELVHRFLCGFGVADPNQHSSLSTTVETNPPREGENPRTAGVFLRDELGAYTSGIQEGSEAARFKQAEFREFAQDLPWQEIGLREVVVFGPFEDPAQLRDKLAGYVRTVSRFKDRVPAGYHPSGFDH